jgi:predicted permease
MSMTSRVLSLLRNLTRRRRVDRDLDDEVETTFELLVEERIRAGMTPADARRLATIQLGRTASIKTHVREVRAGALVTALLQDARYGVRLLVRSPTFTLFAVASLALGIGATSAIFMLFDALVLRKLPVPEPDRLVVASFGGPGGRFNYSMPYPHFEQIRQHNTTLDGLFAMNPFGRVTVAVSGEADMAEGNYVTGDYYRTLRLTPAIGRLIGPSDDRPGEAVAVLTHAYWTRRFGQRADIVGAPVSLNGVPFTVVGVEPEGFFGTEVGRPYDIAVPMRALELLSEGKPLWNEAFATWIYMMGRMKPGVSIAEAEAEMKAIFAQASMDAARNPNQERLAREHQLRLESAATGNHSDLRFVYERWLRMLLMLLAAVLLLAGLNVATLLLSRSDARQREITTRLALGAGRWRIVRQLLTEAMVLAGISAALGLAIASWGSRALLAIAVPASQRLPLVLSVDSRVVAFTIAVALVTSILFGLIPAIRATSPRPFLTTRQVGGGRRRRLVDRALVASQVALSLVLLLVAGLFLRTVDNILGLETGYVRENVLMFSVDARLAGRRGDDVPATYQRLLEALRAVPGAQSVTVSAVRPVTDSYYFISSVSLVGDKVLPNDQRIRAAYNNIAPGYFGTLGIPLVAGRDFDDRDTRAAPKVVIISERMARHFPGNPVGQRIGGPDDAGEVVGVAKDIRHANVKDAPREVLYFPMFQAEPRSMWWTPTFEIRYAGASGGIAELAREVVARTDPALTMFKVKTLEAQTLDSLARERLLATLTSYFGGFAVLLACIGLYGLLSYGVSQRTAEIGLRMALGAQPGAVRRLIVRDAAATVLAGALVGAAGALAAARLVRTQLFGVEPNDPTALILATTLLLIMAFAAAYLPARRASRIDPLAALRHE